PASTRSAWTSRHRQRRDSGSRRLRTVRLPAGESATAARAASARSHACSPQRGQGVQLLRLWNYLVVGIAELVAARAQVLVARLVHRHLDRRADECGDDLPFLDEVRLGSAEIAGVDRIAGQTRQRRLSSDVPYLELTLVGGEVLGDVSGLGGCERL